MPFVHLHTHSSYSPMSGIPTLEALCQAARKQGAQYLALTDTNGLYGAIHFLGVAREAGLKPILGAELVHGPQRAALLAKTPSGYANLCRILSARHCDESIDFIKTVAQHRAGLNEAIRTQEPGGDQAEGLIFDLSKIDLEKLRNEFAKKVQRKASAIQDIRTIVEQKLAEMLARNPTRMDYQLKYEEIVSDYNLEKDRTTIEETFRRLVELVNNLDEEQERATREGLDEEELALFDILLQQKNGSIDKASRERVKQASRGVVCCCKNKAGRA